MRREGQQRLLLLATLCAFACVRKGHAQQSALSAAGAEEPPGRLRQLLTSLRDDRVRAGLDDSVSLHAAGRSPQEATQHRQLSTEHAHKGGRKGRVGKRGRARSRQRIIPDVSLAATNDLWEEKDRRRSLLAIKEEGETATSQPVFAISSTQLQRQREQAAARASFGERRLTAVHRGMQHQRPNGVMEMPDPEAAEYLEQHESEDLGADVLASARTHYNGTAAGAHQPASTDSHATREEMMTPVTAESAGADGQQQQQEEQPQEGYPWYTQYPPPSFPHADIGPTNHSIHTDLKLALEAAAEEKRKAEEAALAERARAATAARVGHKSVADLARENLAAEAGARASAWMADRLAGPGDGGELPPGTYIHRASGGGGQQAPGKAALEQLAQLRSQARVWMSMQEVSLIESYLRPTDTMLEFGAGYSTVWFSQFVKEYYSIEHNATWFDEIKATISGARPNVHLQVAPVAKGYKGWGGGFEEGTVDQFSHYIKAVDNFNVTAFDRVLVDGRARAACAEYVLKFLHADSLVFIHDYQQRFFYHGVVEQFYAKVAETYDGQSLVVVRPKPEALRAAARTAVASLASS